MQRRTALAVLALLVFSTAVPLFVYFSYPSLLESARESVRVPPFPSSIEAVASTLPRGGLSGRVVSLDRTRGLALVELNGRILPVVLRGCWLSQGRLFLHPMLDLKPGMTVKVDGIFVRMGGRNLIIAKSLEIDGQVFYRVPCRGHHFKHLH